MNILFISKDFSGANLCLRLLREGNEIRACVEDPLYHQVLDGLIEKVSLEEGLAWIGTEDLIVVDAVGYGPLQDQLRSEGYAVVGGSAGGDLLEDDRLHCQRVFEGHGIKTVPIHQFEMRSDVIRFIKDNPGRWVMKQNGDTDKTFCYVGKLADGSDVLDLLEYDCRSRKEQGEESHFILQQFIDGVEIGVGRYFNGNDWVGPVEINIEHKKLFSGGLGPKTCEMGTLMWYDPDESNRLFQEVLAPLAPYLRKIDFRGDFDVNCVVNENGAFPLEATSRFGYPAVQLQSVLHRSSWTQLLCAVARGESFDLEWQEGFGIVILIALPPFPFYQCVGKKRSSIRGLKIHFREEPNAEDQRHIHWEEVTAHKDKDGRHHYYSCSESGYLMHVSGVGETVEVARKDVYRRAGNIVVPKMFYRNDIGLNFIENDRERLVEWGYL